MAIPVDGSVVDCVAETEPPIDATVVVVGDGLGSSGDSIVLINGIICTVHICTYVIDTLVIRRNYPSVAK